MINITIFCAKNNLCRQQSKWYCHCNHMTDASINHMVSSSCTINNQIFLQKNRLSNQCESFGHFEYQTFDERKYQSYDGSSSII